MGLVKLRTQKRTLKNTLFAVLLVCYRKQKVSSQTWARELGISVGKRLQHSTYR